EVLYRGVKVEKEKNKLLELRRKFSVIWQNPYLYHGTVEHNIKLPLKLRNVGHKIIKRKVFNIANKLEIKHLLHKNSNKISGGEKQKVSIARSLITEPEILFIDEPNSSLDYKSSRYFNNLFTDLISEGVTILLITHDLYQIENYAEYITVLERGEVASSGAINEVDF
ncbi:MAG: ATP-binding cassette domain-containing protein, partial [Halanaerobiales bacterium]|nr:ATP-binding cassette domain-containing protein [Halanaerobiales bacterium]